MNFSWVYQTPNKGWWANYRWHITEPSEKLGLKLDGWKKSFFRSGWQNKTLKIEGEIDNAKKCLQALQNGNIVAFGGRFRGADYDKNAELIIKQAKRSLKAVIKKHEKGENVNIKEVAAVPPSYYNMGKIVSISLVIILFVGLILYLLIFRKKSNRSRVKY